MKKKYTIVGKFKCHNKNMIVVRINGAASVMPEYEYNMIIATERLYYAKHSA